MCFVSYIVEEVTWVRGDISTFSYKYMFMTLFNQPSGMVLL